LLLRVAVVAAAADKPITLAVLVAQVVLEPTPDFPLLREQRTQSRWERGVMVVE
jgi:hypothetical protein